jgi:hypothetical protein
MDTLNIISLIGKIYIVGVLISWIVLFWLEHNDGGGDDWDSLFSQSTIGLGKAFIWEILLLVSIPAIVVSIYFWISCPYHPTFWRLMDRLKQKA